MVISIYKQDGDRIKKGKPWLLEQRTLSNQLEMVEDLDDALQEHSNSYKIIANINPIKSEV